MSTFGEIGERAVIEEIRKAVRRPGLPDNLTDDAAVLFDMPKGAVVVCSDSVTFERHKPEGMDNERFGWMAAAVNLSDLASMGAKPVGLTASLLIPENTEINEIVKMMSGFDQCAEFCDTFVIGGDTKPGEGAICATAIGTMENRKPMTRNGAKKGDVIAVTGPLGGAAAGFYALKEKLDLPEAIFSLTTPIPKVTEGIALASTEIVTSCMDLSDGLSTSINTLCKENKLGAVIEWDLLPKHDDVDYVHEKLNIPLKDLIMDFGGEYELIFTFDRKDVEILMETDVDFKMIGIMTEGEEILLHRDEKYEEIGNGAY